MARLSGLPSEHHHEGPGDAPRRKRGRPSKSQSQSQSQTPAEDVTSTGKRTASPSAEISQTKRTKRVEVELDEDEDEDQIAQEMQQSFSRSQHGDTIHVERSSQTTTRRNKRRQSEPLIGRDGDSDDELAYPILPSTQPVKGLTPHLDRVGASRSRFTNARRARMSMPASFSVEPIDDVDETSTQVQFVPLKAALDGRTRRRLRRSHLSQELINIEDHQKQDKKQLLELRRQLKAQDKKIADLEFRLEARRMGEIDISDEHALELETALEEARNEINDLRASSIYNGDEHEIDELSDDDDHLLLVSPDELDFSQDLVMENTPNGKYASRVHELSQSVTLESFPRISQLSHDTLMEMDDTAVPKGLDDQAVERYERELTQYSRALGESQGALRVITLELQNLHYIEAGADAKDILTELRHGLESLRAEIEKFVPGSTKDLTYQQLLQKIPELFGGIFMELKENIAVIATSQRTEVLLRRQFEGVLDLLGESDERVSRLESELHTLDKSNEEKQRILLDLEEQNTTLTALTTRQSAQLVENDAEIAGLRDENEDKDTALERLREALENYRVNLEQVTTTATTFEQDHHEMIEQMEQEHALAIQSLETERAAEQEGREIAEADALQKQVIIDELEASIARMETEVEQISIDLSTLRERLATETEGRELAESERDEQTNLVYQHANTIENLNEQILELKQQVTEFRTNLEAERAQREKTEADLDEANEKVEDLTARLHDAGLQANELRSKLFQLQQEKEETIATLQEEAREREVDLNDQLVRETETRKEVEDSVAERDLEIEELRAALAVVEANLVNMTQARVEAEQDRDIQITNLANQLADLQNKYAALENSTNSTITSLQANITDLNNQVLRQQAEIKRLNEQLVESDRVHVEETTLLEEKIMDLEDNLAASQADNASYRKENTSLSQRVESEANELLNIVGAHNDEVISLRTVIATQAAAIENLKNTSAERAQEHEELLEERTREMTELQLLGDARLETIVSLEQQIDKLKEQFRLAEEDTRITIDALTTSQRALQEQNEKLAEKLKERNAAALQAIQEMKAKRVEVRSQTVDLNRVVAGKVTKTSEKVKIGKKGVGKKKSSKRQWDSGFGVDENVEDEDIGESSVAA
ncbi:hypothetical protein T440DRAFT_297196 [Plenodomus tracheiphilus IPT5]|uniref:Uncharacterized protein n=1 Tax=Plenodomus tracheiphilus IPT5 TaxID=1408161 RepID=A0A6A7AP00_9PLEO|nr:hypothetical protein T440DRAFT_297196 [Plenodomus tracheiphilus IPT5]